MYIRKRLTNKEAEMLKLIINTSKMKEEKIRKILRATAKVRGREDLIDLINKGCFKDILKISRELGVEFVGTPNC